MYYANNQDESKGNSHYNVGGDVKDSGVDIKTGSISGKIEGNHTVESLQDTFDSRNRGYSISTGIGVNSTKGNKGTTYNTNIQSVSVGYNQGKTVQRITREVYSSPIGQVYAVKIAAGTVMYEKPVGYQGGMYLGGMEIEQVFIREPWEIPGITIMKYSK